MNKEKILLKKFEEILDNGKLNDFLENEIKEVVKNSYDSNLKGWYHYIIMTDKGQLYITSPISHGDKSIGCYKDNRLLLYKICAYSEMEYQIQWDDILYMGETIEERHNIELLILDNIINKNEVKALKEEIENCNQNFSLLDCLNNNKTYPQVERAIKSLFPDIWQELIVEYAEHQWEYEKDKIKRNIENTIEELKSHLMEF